MKRIPFRVPPGYFLGFFFYMDCISTISLLFDIHWTKDQRHEQQKPVLDASVWAPPANPQNIATTPPTHRLHTTKYKTNTSPTHWTEDDWTDSVQTDGQKTTTMSVARTTAYDGRTDG